MTIRVLGRHATRSGTVPEGGDPITGLQFPSNIGADTRFVFSGAALVQPFPATFIWRLNPIQQTGFYTTFFWARADGTFTGTGYYGCHPYPPGGGSGTSHNWEVSAAGQDYITDDNGNNTTVTKGQWYTQACVVQEIAGSELQVKFYWDLSVSVLRVITFETTVDDYALAFPPSSPGLTFGTAPWAPTEELLSGILRGIQLYDAVLSESDIQTEAANHTVNTPQTAAGLAAVWYMNQNPTPDDISDKSGEAHHPSWVNANRPTLWEG